MTTRTYFLVGDIAGSIDNWVDRSGPFDSDLETLYSAIGEHLERYALRKEQSTNLFPMEGVISAPEVKASYEYLKCYVENRFFPAGKGICHSITITGQNEDIAVVEAVLNPVIERTALVRYKRRDSEEEL
jgi:hypothetical protein